MQVVVVLALLVSLFGVGPSTATEPIPIPAPAPLAHTQLPLPGQDNWREHVQLVWNSSATTLDRRRYTFFDPFYASDLDVFWEPRDTAAETSGPISGDGLLTWRQKGSARFDETTIISQYRGEMRHGQMNGRGTFVARTGLRYDGSWADSLMHGHGQLRLPDGDAYDGSFRKGRIDGHGIYIDGYGRIFDGGFCDGQRSGDGKFAAADEGVFASRWINGVEDEYSRRPVDGDWELLHRVQLAPKSWPGIAMSIGVTSPAQFCCIFPIPQLGYATTAYADKVEIYPDAPKLLEVWRGQANIVVKDPYGFDWARAQSNEYSFLNYVQQHIKPVPIQFGIENRTDRSVAIVGGYLNVFESKSELRPALQATELEPLSAQSISFSIENYGWAPATGAQLSFRFETANGERRTDSMVLAIGDVKSVHSFSFEQALIRQGIRRDAVARLAEACKGKDKTGWQPCLARLTASGIFGNLTDYVFIQDRKFGVRAVGRVAFNWRDADGRLQNGEAPFDAFIPLGTFYSPAECEGGDLKDINYGKPFELKLDTSNYRIPFSINGAVSTASVGRWRVLLDAPKSSRHQFQLVLLLADGREIISRKISLLIYRPNAYPESIRPFQPRC